MTVSRSAAGVMGFLPLVLGNTVSWPVPHALRALVTLGIPLGAFPVGALVGYFLFRAVRFLKNRGRAGADGAPAPDAARPLEEVQGLVSTATSSQAVRLTRATHPPSQAPPQNDRFTLLLLLVFIAIASAILLYYPVLFRPYDTLVGWVGATLYWPQAWPGVYAASFGAPLVYDYIFPMYVALVLTWLLTSTLALRAGKLPPGRRALGVSLFLLYFAVELVIDALLFTVPGISVRNLGLIIRALTGATFLTLIMYCTFSVPNPLPVIPRRFPRDRGVFWLFFGLGLVAIAVAGTSLYYLSVYLRLTGLLPSFTVLLLLPALSVPIWAAMARPFYFRQRRRQRRPSVAEYHPSVSILIPAFNEEADIRESIMAADRASANYPGPVSIVVGNDGSTDRTSGIAREAIRHLKHSTGTVVDLPHGGKSDALNGALQYAQGEIIVRCDADTRISPLTGFAPAIPYFADPEVGGVQAQIWPRQKNGWTRKLRAMEIAWQHLFLRPATMSARAAEVLDGAFSLFRRKDLIELGGWLPWNGEDTELSIRLQREGYRVCLAFEAVGYEDVPPNYRSIRKQRIRWTRGGIYANARHYPALFSATPEFGGLAILFYYLLVLHAGARSLVYIYLALLTVFLGIPGIFHAIYLLAALLALRSIPLVYFLLKMRRYDVLPWVPTWPFLGIVKTIFRFEGFGTVRHGSATEFY